MFFATLVKTESCKQKQRQIKVKHIPITELTAQGVVHNATFSDYLCRKTQKKEHATNLRRVHVSNMIVGEGPRFWLREQANGAGWGDRETETLVSICGKSSAVGQRTHSHKHFDGVAVTAVQAEIWERKRDIGKAFF